MAGKAIKGTQCPVLPFKQQDAWPQRWFGSIAVPNKSETEGRRDLINVTA